MSSRSRAPQLLRAYTESLHEWEGDGGNTRVEHLARSSALHIPASLESPMDLVKSNMG